VHEVFIKTQNHPELVGLHREMYARFASPEAARNPWKLIYMSWKNLLCYGDANHIDFSAMNGIYNLIGDNTLGKSSVIDILIFGLYDSVIRGDKKSLPLLGDANYELIIEFESADKRYVINRVGDRNASKVQLYSRGSDSRGSWTNISGGTMAATYTIVNNIIGDEREMLRMCIASQDRIILKDAQDILNEFKYYLKLDCFDRIEEYISEQIKDENRRIRELEKTGGIPIVINENVADIDARISECNEQLRKLDAERFSLGLKSVDDLARYLDVVRGFTISRDMKSMFTEKQFDIHGIFQGSLMEFSDPSKLIGLESRITSLIEEQARIRSGMLPVDPREAEMIAELRGIDIMRNYETDLTMLRTRVDKLKDWIACAERGIAPESVGGDPDLSRFDFGVLTRTNMEWNPECKCCAVNSGIVNGMILRSPEVSGLITSLSREKSQCEQRVAQITALRGKIAQLAQIRAANAIIANKNASLVKAESEIGTQIAGLKALREIKVYSDNYIKLVTLLGNANDNMSVIARSEKNNRDRVSLQTEVRRLEDARKRIADNIAYNESISRITTSLAKSRERVKQYKDYIKLLSFKSKGLGHYIFAQHVDRIESMINKILRQVADFTIKFQMEDHFDVIVVGNTKSIVARASGFQRFVIDMCFRISLVSTHPYLTKLLVIDEGFSWLDSKNIGNMVSFFKRMNKSQISIIIVSHIDKLQSIGTPIKISRDRYSHIQFGMARIYSLFAIESESLELRGNVYYCKACNKTLKARSSADKKHIQSKKHAENSSKLMQNSLHK
jgi:DNA repair exonuclease SbcCD ATPase subunit